MTRDEMNHIRARLVPVSQGEWREYIDDEGNLVVEMDSAHKIYFGNMEGSCMTCHANQRFVAHSRDDVENLLNEVESCWRKIAEMKESLAGR